MQNKIFITIGLIFISIPAFASDQFESFNRSARLQQLSTMQYDVTQDGDTEQPFHNAYWDNKAPGIYVDVVSGEPLYSSTDKYDSGTGWPSFTKPIDKKYIVTKVDNGVFSSSTEVRSKYGNSHLGHVFDDGPKETGGMRYCMNSSALRFIPESGMAKSGYGQYLYLFQKK